MKNIFLFVAVAAFIGLGVVDFAAGEVKTGLASILLAVVNGALLS